MPLDVTFLRDLDNGGQQKQPSQIASKLAKFINDAKSSLHIAIYDFRLQQPELLAPVIEALKGRADAGIEVQIAFDHGKPNAQDFEPFIGSGGDPAPKGTKAFLEQVFQDSKVQIQSIAGSKLMHNKYIIRDVNTRGATLWTGSANFTDDAWTYQENNILQIPSPELCAFYETDFQELWVSGNIKTTGVNDTGTVYVGQTAIDVAFAPGEGKTIDHQIASLISSAQSRIKIASMVLTSHAILGAIDDALHHKQVEKINGIYDGTQMSQIVKKWQNSPKSGGIVQTFQEVASHLVAKKSVAYKAEGKHNFMHNKIVVCDNAVITGSFNLSRNATQNAENLVVLHSKVLADQYSAYIDELITQYK